MKISTNSVGNYSPSAIRNNLSAKSNNSLPKEALKDSETITAEEKQFFVDKYPENKKEIMDHHFYQKSGKLSGVNVGSLFDKRG